MFKRIVKERSALLTISLLFCVAMIFGLSSLQANANYTAYFDRNDPVLTQHNEIVDEFKQYDSVIVILDFGAKDALDERALQLATDLKQSLEVLPHVTRVSSVLDIQARDDSATAAEDLFSELFVEENSADTGPKVDRAAIQDDPRGRGLGLSHDGHALAIEVAYELPSSADPKQLLGALARLRSSVEATVAASEIAVNVGYSGALILNESYISVVRHDLKLFLPALITLLVALLSYLLRSVRLALSLLCVALVAVVNAFGLGGYLGLELAAINAFAPVMIMSLAVAGGVHVVTTFQQNREAGLAAPAALSESLSENATPLSLTSATTAASFLALTMSPSPPLQAMGIIVAAGVIVAWLFNFTLLPFLILTSDRAKRNIGYRIEMRPLLNALSWCRPRGVLLSFVIVCGVAATLVGGNEINDNVFEYFPVASDLRRDTQILNEKFSGINKISYAIDTGHPFGVFDRELLIGIRKFGDWLKERNDVHRAMSLIDLPAVRDKLGKLESDKLVERYRDLAGDHSASSLGIEQLTSDDFSTLTVHVYLSDLDAIALIEFDRLTKDWLRENLSNYEIRGGAGSSLVFAHLGQRNARTMIYSLGIALIIVSAICAFVLRTPHGLWVGALCNLSPILLVYAAWALADGRISIGGAVVIGMILGIIVDDTLFLLMKYRRLIDRKSRTALSDTVTQIGPALIITSISLSAGLATGLLSDFAPITAMSGLSIAVILSALIVDLLILPSLLRVARVS